MKITGAEAVIRVLLEHGVDTVFGYPGGTAIIIYDELYKHADQITHILTAHEQGAAHAADGYARSTGKTGVAIATSGPGATNLVTGIATAFMDSVPTVFITANVGNTLIGRDAFQEVCITGVTFPITKHSFFVNRKEDLVDAMRDAFRIANEGRKGPVLVDMTKDVTEALIDYKPAPNYPLRQITDPQEDSKLAHFADYINNAERPLILAGGGVISAGASKEVQELIRKADIPAVNTLMGLGSIPSSEERFFGMLGMHGSYAANRCAAEADLILAIGTRFSDRVALNPKKFARKAKVLQIDLDRSEVNKNVMVAESIIGDCRDVLQKLLPKIGENSHRGWVEQIAAWDREKPTHVRDCNARMNPEEIIRYICAHTDKETVYATDVGQHQMWAAQYVQQTRPRNYLSSGGLGTMGFGYGAAIGAQLGNPDKRVIHFTSDGSLHMNLNEACTAVSHRLPIITVIFNNRVLGMVYQWQTLLYEGRYSQTTPDRKTDFVKLIEAFGGHGFRARTMEEFAQAFGQALKCEGPVWIDCDIAAEDLVLPMIQNGQTVDEIIY